MKHVRLATRLAIAAATWVVSTARADPTWSDRFAGPGGGVALSPLEDGPVCLMSYTGPDGPRLYVGGEFTAIDGAPFRSIASYDGRAWRSVNGVVAPFNNERVLSLTTFPVDGVSRVVAAGFFDAPGTRDGLGYLDASDTLRAFPPVPQRSQLWFAGVYGWASPSGPELMLSTSLSPSDSDYIFRRTPDGYGLMTPGVITVTNAFAVFDDGLGGGPALYIGVPMSGGNFADKISRWNGSTLTPMNPGPMNWANALCVHDDGLGGGPALYAAGVGCRRYRAGAWEAVPGAPLQMISALVSHDDGSGPALYFAGQFTTVDGRTMSNIARLRAGLWESLDGGLTGGAVAAMAVFDEDGPGPRRPALYAVGKFTAAGGISSPGIARWGVSDCLADANGDGAVSVQDVFEFLGAFFAGDPRADIDGSGTVSVQDVFEFLAAYFAGCS